MSIEIATWCGDTTGSMLRSSLASAESASDEDRRPCASCGYDLRGLSENRCPECGSPFDPTELSIAEIPWLRRSRLNIGAIEAYTRTIWLVVMHTRRFASQVHRPCQINPVEAGAFTWVSVWIATVSFVSALIITSSSSPGGFFLAELLLICLAVGPGTLVFLVIATRVDSRRVSASMGFAAGTRFRRLARFCCAPLGLMPIVPATVALAGAWLDPYAMATTMMVGLSAIGLIWWVSGTFYAIFGGKLRAGSAVGEAISRLFLFISAAVVGVFVMVPLAILTGIILSIIRG